MTSIGQLILDEIGQQRMCTPVLMGDNMVNVWSANTAEQLEALVEQYYERKPEPYPANQILDNILDAMDNADRLRQLSHRDLVEECLSTDAADYDVVIELMNRVLPGWEK